MSSALKVIAVAVTTVVGAFLPVSGQTPGSNPIIRDVYTADPAPLVVGNTVYLYTGHDEPNSSFYTMNNWRCYSSQEELHVGLARLQSGQFHPFTLDSFGFHRSVSQPQSVLTLMPNSAAICFLVFRNFSLCCFIF
jgi:hypothetical protein